MGRLCTWCYNVAAHTNNWLQNPRTPILFGLFWIWLIKRCPWSRFWSLLPPTWSKPGIPKVVFSGYLLPNSRELLNFWYATACNFDECTQGKKFLLLLVLHLIFWRYFFRWQIKRDWEISKLIPKLLMVKKTMVKFILVKVQ